MANKYLGKVENIVSVEELKTLTSVSGGDLNHTGDIVWLKFIYNNKLLLIADRCIIVNRSWDAFDSVGVVKGKEISIKDEKYICRFPTGGDSNPASSNGGEWDDLIVKFCPNDSDSNWTISTMCQEYYKADHEVVTRGGMTLEKFSYINRVNYVKGTGWRPVLELINNPPSCSIQSENLGDMLNFVSKHYIIADTDNDSFTLIEKLDGTPIRTLENQVSGTEYTLDLSEIWDSLEYGKHTIEIIATDSNSLSSTVTLTFNKIKEITQPISTESSLKELVNHIGNIDKDIDYLKFKLSDNLNGKGIECSNTDKISSLIDKVSNIHLGKKWASGTCSSDSSTYSPQVLGNTVNVQCAKLEIPNLDFVPSFIFAKNESDSVNDYSLYYKNTSEYFSYGRQNRLNTGNLGSWIIKPGDIFRVDSDSIVIPVQNVNKTFDWVAFE